MLALYASWVAFTHALISRHDEEFTMRLVDLFVSPGSVWEFARALNVDGWYTIVSPDNLEPLVSLGVAGSTTNPYLRINGWECQGCHETAAIQATIAATVTNEDGKLEEQTKDVTPIWLVTPEQFKRLG
jgi:hypothetical protein